MKIATITSTRINYSENSFVFLHELGIEINLEEILAEEFDRGLPSDINNCA